MSGGLLALLDDVIALTKLTAVALDDAAGQAAQASAKAAGIVIDDTAVTPRYVVGLAAERELPVVWRIARGSLKNKIVYLLPAGLALTAFAPWALTPLLMIGGLYLCFEGYEKVHSLVLPHDEAHDDRSAAAVGDATMLEDKQLENKQLEDERVTGAIRTDMVLSAEIMALALAGVVEPNLVTQALVLALVAIAVTAGVYGAVALLVKADDFGLYLAQKGGPVSKPLGRALVYGVPPFLNILATIGTFAMLWVGGGILIHGMKEFGFSMPENLLHSISETLHATVPGIGGVLGWFATAGVSAVAGLVAGALTALIALPVMRAFKSAA